MNASAGMCGGRDEEELRFLDTSQFASGGRVGPKEAARNGMSFVASPGRAASNEDFCVGGLLDALAGSIPGFRDLIVGGEFAIEVVFHVGEYGLPIPFPIPFAFDDWLGSLTASEQPTLGTLGLATEGLDMPATVREVAI